jgi:tRNA G10  N-methylase Trm11
VFPHSFAPELVSWFIDELGVEGDMTLLDPFCGAGTTLVEAENRGLVPIGVDLLPLAVLASRAKVARPTTSDLRSARLRTVKAARAAGARTPANELLRRALTPTAYGRLAAALNAADGAATDCVRLAVLSIARRFSKLVADGGWLRETEAELRPRHVPDLLDEALRRIEADVASSGAGQAAVVQQADARALPLADGSVDAVITSPPYPNRHDYTRVFAVELELGFALGESVKALRYAALHSHPEARPPLKPRNYRASKTLRDEVARVAEEHPDPRIPRMLKGYFADMFLVMGELARVLRKGGVAALVVGNAQYAGVPIPVDEHLARLARRAGLEVADIILLRERGNSAQQMATFGRHPSRESAVVVRRLTSSTWRKRSTRVLESSMDRSIPTAR